MVCNEEVWKTCNIKAKGCHEKYEMYARALNENVEERKRYTSRYDACGNPACQKNFLVAPKE